MASVEKVAKVLKNAEGAQVQVPPASTDRTQRLANKQMKRRFGEAGADLVVVNVVASATDPSKVKLHVAKRAVTTDEPIAVAITSRTSATTRRAPCRRRRPTCS